MRCKTPKALLTILWILIAPSATAFSLDGTIFDKAGKPTGIDPYLLYSISLKSSSRYMGKGLVRPSAYAISTTHQHRHFDNLEDAQAALEKILLKTKNVQIGLMQISHRWHPQFDPKELLIPEKNLLAGISILKRAMKTTKDPVYGVGRFFYYSDKEKALAAGKKVWETYSRLKELTME